MEKNNEDKVIIDVDAVEKDVAADALIAASIFSVEHATATVVRSPASPATPIYVRKRPRSSIMSKPKVSQDDLDYFKHKQHSLQIPVSNLAAIVGYNPFSDLPQLALDLVYKSRLGQELLEHDAQALDVELAYSHSDLFKSIANKAGRETVNALCDALQVKSGDKLIKSIQDVSSIKSNVINAAKQSNKLTDKEFKLLNEGVRSMVDTSFGKQNEDQALDFYEKQCGWKVYNRNAEYREWPFVVEYNSSKSVHDNNNIDNGGNVLVPMHDARARVEEDSAVKSCKRKSYATEATKENVSNDGYLQQSSLAAVEDYTDFNSDNTPRPFVVLMGSIDGMRDDFCIANNADFGTAKKDEFDNVQFRPLIVECKHRIKSIRDDIPLYEQIQAITYCLMYNVTQAELVQVLRCQNDKVSIVSTTTEVAFASKTDQDRLDTLDRLGGIKKGNSMSGDNNKEEWRSTVNNERIIVNKYSPSKPKTGKSTAIDRDDTNNSSTLQPKITATRIDLYDPHFQHHLRWNDTILPRLLSFVQAVYTIRSDDHLRYRLLMSVASHNIDQEKDTAVDAWQVLFELCPWLKDCDTAFKRL